MLDKEQIKMINEFFSEAETEIDPETKKEYFVRSKKREEIRTILFEHLYCSNDFDVLTRKQLANNKFKVTKKVETFNINRANIEKHDKILYV